jgi:hypothetical protein
LTLPWLGRLAELSKPPTASAGPPLAEAQTYSGVVISNDLPANSSRFLVIHNGRNIDVHIGVPLADPAVHSGKIIQFNNRYAGPTCHIVPAAKKLCSCRTRQVPFGQSRYHAFRSELGLALRLDEDLLRLSRQHNDSGGLLLGYSIFGYNLQFAGKFADSGASRPVIPE